MTWSAQQDAAIKAVRAWLADRNGQQVFRLFGFAGTGKTTLARHLAAEVQGEVLFACFTGKAALVMRKKGCAGASTIHSLIYTPRQDEATGKLSFRWNGESDAAFASLIVVDEVSQVDETLAFDLLRYGRKVLVLGDPAQLPPVKGEGFFINAEPDVMLTEVHRQAADNPIIRMSMEVREGMPLRPGRYGESLVVDRRRISVDAMREQVLGADQVLCGMNKTRHALNQRVRFLRGRQGEVAAWHPVVGDRLVCLRNNRDKNLLNGGLWTAEKVDVRKRYIDLRVRSLDLEGAAPVDVSVLHEFFAGTDKDLHWRDKIGWDEFTFGDALTVHKAQGSQWDHVMLYDESFAFRDDARKHLYTALTRAAERVTVAI